MDWVLILSPLLLLPILFLYRLVGCGLVLDLTGETPAPGEPPYIPEPVCPSGMGPPSCPEGRFAVLFWAVFDPAGRTNRGDFTVTFTVAPTDGSAAESFQAPLCPIDIPFPRTVGADGRERFSFWACVRAGESVVSVEVTVPSADGSPEVFIPRASCGPAELDATLRWVDFRAPVGRAEFTRRRCFVEMPRDVMDMMGM